MDLLGFLRTQARANRLANRRLHAAMAPLSREEFHAARSGFFPSLAATLNHILEVDLYYLAALHGEADMVEQYAAIRPGHSVTLRLNPGFGHGHDRKVSSDPSMFSRAKRMRPRPFTALKMPPMRILEFVCTAIACTGPSICGLKLPSIVPLTLSRTRKRMFAPENEAKSPPTRIRPSFCTAIAST